MSNCAQCTYWDVRDDKRESAYSAKCLKHGGAVEFSFSCRDFNAVHGVLPAETSITQYFHQLGAADADDDDLYVYSAIDDED